MTAIELNFLTGRFHATPWGRHVNEGAVEWPPSPWRLLRALIATWKRKAPDLDEATIQGLLVALCEPPQYYLPPATFGHTRHYMPWFKKGPGDKTLVFDSFVALPKETPVQMIWPELDLPSAQRDALNHLLPLLGTLGRAESWCEGRLISEETDLKTINCTPSSDQPSEEVVRVLGVDPTKAFQNNKFYTLAKKQPQKGGPKYERNSHSAYDPDWHLCMETLWLHEQRLSIPPGAKWLSYERKSDALAQPKSRIGVLRARPKMQVARFALDSAVLPLTTDTIRVAEAARVALMSQYGWLTKVGDVKGKSRIFSGKEIDGTPITGHRHCYFLPTSESLENQQRGRIDHLTLYTADGFEPNELRAIDRLRQIRMRDRQDSGHPLGVVLLGVGVSSEFQPGPIRAFDEWLSATPFVAPRHPKTRGPLKNTDKGNSDISRFLISQMWEELKHHLQRSASKQSIDSVEIELLRDDDGNTRRWCPIYKTFRERSIEFNRFRQKHSDDGGRRPAAFFRLKFQEPVSGPLALGHSSHFGLGLFLPVDS